MMDIQWVYIVLTCFVIRSNQYRFDLSPGDPTSYSLPENASITHISLHLKVDFEKKVFHGIATLYMRLHTVNTHVPLDVNNLTIHSVHFNNDVKLKYHLSYYYPFVGSRLTIYLPDTACNDDHIILKINYTTDPSASALTWLKPKQTLGKCHPFVFSQCSPIHARSILPCQDTPSVRFSFDAKVEAPRDMTVLMSALKVDFRRAMFYQPLPITSSIFAIAVGDLQSKRLGPRTKVWSEKAELERNAKEFSNTEEYLKVAENLCYASYEWGVYEMLVLPPIYPHAAMENPCLTFVSPTIVTGDQSQTYIVAHEIMHSWTGNSVSIRNFQHFWLKEGFTVYLERFATSSLNKNSLILQQDRDLQYLIGLQTLTDAVESMGPSNPLTKLVVNLACIPPDEAFSVIPYEKGAIFLRYLEELLGGPKVFIKFIQCYVKRFRMKSIDTEDFKSFLLNYFKHHPGLEAIDWHTWLHKAGMPPVIPRYDTTLIEPAVDLIEAIINGHAVSPYDVAQFNIYQKIYLMQLLIEQAALPLKKLKKIGKAYNFTHSQNTEITYRWLRLSLRSRDEDIISNAFDFVNKIGRLKYVQPLYKELHAWSTIRGITTDNFLDNEKYMSFATANSLRRTLELDVKG